MVDAEDAHGWTPLMYAARDGHTTCVQYLLNAGADKDKENANRFKALTYASERGHSEVMQLLAGSIEFRA